MTLERAERRSYREHHPYETERQADFTPEKVTGEKYVLHTDLGEEGLGTRTVFRELLALVTFPCCQSRE